MSSVLAPDGSPVEVFATFPAGPAPGLIGARLRPGGSVLDLGCGAGRLARPLAEAGHSVVGVDISEAMVAALGAAGLPGVEGVVADIANVDLGRTFDAVLLASYLVNTVDPELRHRYLTTCRRHVGGDGAVFVQRHHPDFVGGSEVEESTEDGFSFRYERLAVDGLVVTARMTYGHGGQTWHQEFTTAILDQAAMEAALGRAGLRFIQWLDDFDTWAEATPT